jgi:hypothetical protein
MIDIVLIAIVAGVTYFVAQEGPWGAAFTLFSVIIAGLVAMNFFEPLANALGNTMGFAWQTKVDIIALLGIFSLIVFLMRMGTDALMPTYVEVHGLLWDIGRWALGAATGYVVMAIALTALHTAPLPREFAGFTPERGNFFNMAPDRQWLAFVQYVSEKSFSAGTAQVFDYSDETTPGTPPGWQFATFPIRYAHRREMSAGGGGFAPAPAPGPVTPVAPGGAGPAPAGGSRGGGF